MLAQFKENTTKQKAQALVEFALAIPIVLVLVIGMFEVGRLIVYYSAVNSAAREAARYGAASGTINGVPRYCDVAGIRAAAVDAGFIAGVQANSTFITIEYDDGPSRTTVWAEGTGPCAAGGKLKDGTRIYITITVTYTPSVNFPSSNVGRTVRATAARTILSEIYVPDAIPATAKSDPNNQFPPGSNSPTPTPTATRTATPTVTPTGTLPTPTAILPPTNTPIVIIPTLLPVVPTCTLGHSDLVFSNAAAPTWNLINYYNSPVTIAKIEVFSNIAGQTVSGVGFGGVGIFAGSVGTPSLIKSGWSGTTADRQINAGQTKAMVITLGAADMIGSLRIKVTFDIGGCTILDSSLAQP